jgi:hypothetical protein
MIVHCGGSFVCIVWFLVVPQLARGQADSARLTPELHPGAIELNLSGSWISIEGSSRYDLAIRSGMFFEVPGGLGAAELEFGYSHVNSLDLLDVQAYASWQRAFGDSPLYPFIALSGGLRQEWLGSFDQIRYPVGMSAGFRVLLNQHVTFRTEYKLRRVLHDPVRDFTEQQLVFGISVLFRNDP